MQVKITTKIGTGTIPAYATNGSAGCDIVTVDSVYLRSGETFVLSTDLYVEVPAGYEMQIRSRSGLASKGIVVANSPGTIDSDYRGEIRVILRNTSSVPYEIKAGDRIAQAVFAKVEQATFVTVDSLSNTARNEGGFGSTGRN